MDLQAVSSLSLVVCSNDSVAPVGRGEEGAKPKEGFNLLIGLRFSHLVMRAPNQKKEVQDRSS